LTVQADFTLVLHTCIHRTLIKSTLLSLSPCSSISCPSGCLVIILVNSPQDCYKTILISLMYKTTIIKIHLCGNKEQFFNNDYTLTFLIKKSYF
jgi:hypothetical protein